MAFKASRPSVVKKKSPVVPAEMVPDVESPPVASPSDFAKVASSAEVATKAETAGKPVSIEDLIGGPIEKNNLTPAKQDLAPRDNPTNPDQLNQSEVKKEEIVQSPAAAPQAKPFLSFNQRYSQERPMGSYTPRRGGGGFSSGGSSSWQRNRPGGGFRPQGNPSYRMDMRRDPMENGYSQDINVPTETVRGVLDTLPEGHGFLRPKYTPSDRDVYISQSQIRRFLLRNGDMVEGQARAPKESERFWGLLKVEKINEHPAETMAARPKFEDLVPVYPNKHLKVETGQLPISTRIIDLVAPIGFGQRGLIVSPPKAGKTTILKELAAGISANYPDVHLMAALIGERPEEVTDISRSVKGEVFASNFDESPAEQTRIAEVALDRAKRLVEMGKDVVILLDSITRLARAYNLVVNPSGRTLSGGFDPAALYPAKRFLGAARCVEPSQIIDETSQTLRTTRVEPSGSEKKENTTGGSLTVIGTALVDTGSRMDDLIYEEFKGTGNMELHLSRAMQERRVFPAIDLIRSGTRHDELLLGEDMMKKISTLRHMLSLLSEEERTVMLIDRLGKTKTNLEFLDSLAKG